MAIYDKANKGDKRPIDCQKCGDFGYTLTAAQDKQYPRYIPAKVLFSIGQRCTCAAGDIFADQQKQWNQLEAQ